MSNILKDRTKNSKWKQCFFPKGIMLELKDISKNQFDLWKASFLWARLSLEVFINV